MSEDGEYVEFVRMSTAEARWKWRLSSGRVGGEIDLGAMANVLDVYGVATVHSFWQPVTYARFKITSS